MSVGPPLVGSTHKPSLPGENVQVSPALAHVAGGSTTFALSETHPAS